MKIKKGGLKVMLFDIETAPNLAYVWGKYEQDVIEYENETYMLCFSYKWLGESKVHSFALRDFKGYKKDQTSDLNLIKKLHEVMCESDVIVAHNGDQFDIKMANAAFIRNGLKPPTPSRTIDTKKIAKARFRFNSNKLDDLGNILGLGRKVETGGFKLWKGCMTGDKSSWDKMIKYNKNDVTLLEKVYLILRPWAINGAIVYTEATGCRTCGGHNMEQRGWSYMDSGKSKKKKMVCKDCGKWNLGEITKI